MDVHPTKNVSLGIDPYPYNLPTLCPSFTAVFSQNCPSLASVGHVWSLQLIYVIKLVPKKTRFSKVWFGHNPIFWTYILINPLSAKYHKKNDLINSRSALPKTWSFSGYPHTRAGIMYPLYPHSIILYYINRFKPPWLNHFSAFPIFSCTPKWGFRKIGMPTHRSIFWDFHCKS